MLLTALVSVILLFECKAFQCSGRILERVRLGKTFREMSLRQYLNHYSLLARMMLTVLFFSIRGVVHFEVLFQGQTEIRIVESQFSATAYSVLSIRQFCAKNT